MFVILNSYSIYVFSLEGKKYQYEIRPSCLLYLHCVIKLLFFFFFIKFFIQQLFIVLQNNIHSFLIVSYINLNNAAIGIVKPFLVYSKLKNK